MAHKQKLNIEYKGINNMQFLVDPINGIKTKDLFSIVPIDGFLLKDIPFERREMLATHSLIHSYQQTPYFYSCFHLLYISIPAMLLAYICTLTVQSSNLSI
jgi:hypothetical protein